MTTSRKKFHLVAHPTTPCPAVEAVAVEVTRTPDHRLMLRYEVTGDLARIQIPRPGEPTSAEPLWKHTCLEAFVGREQTGAYHEFNVSPSGTVGGYCFDSYRAGRPLAAHEVGTRAFVDRMPDALWVSWTIDLGGLAQGDGGDPFRMALATVLEAEDGSLSYWALHHPKNQPDFHHPESFTARV